MSQKNAQSTIFGSLASLGWPLLIGASASSMFYVLIYRGPLNLPVVHRYFAGHPVSIVATGMFFVGIAALCLKMFDVASQYMSLNRVRLEETPLHGEDTGDASRLMEQLAESSSAARRSYLGCRLNDALEFVDRKGSAEGLDDELKYLADLDVARQQESYGLVRIITWATPMLGFLGTVIGITRALGDLDPQQLATNIQLAMESLLAGLYVAFDTTALALSLSIVLMFLQFLIDRIETQLLSTVDLRVNELMVGRFKTVGGSHDPHVASIQRMSEQVLEASQQLVERQTELWRNTIDEAHDRWARLVETNGQTLQESLAGALEQSLEKHAAAMDRIDQQAADRARARWEQLQVALSDNARIMQQQQTEMVKQGEIMAQAVQATGEVMQLEQALNKNLKTLAGAKNFEDTVMSLSAAIHLLSTRLGDVVDGAPQVELAEPSTKGRAA